MFFKTASILVFSILSEFSIATCSTVDTLRLPNNSYPLKYDLWLKVNVEDKSTFFEGNVKIHVKILEESDSITLHACNLKIRSIRLTDLSSLMTYQNISWKFRTIKNFVIIKMPQTALPTSEFLLDIHYHGKMTEADDDFNSNKGFQIASYQDVNEITENYIFTDFEATHARECLPCYDEPAIRAPFSLQIEHHSSYNAVANMPVISREQSNKSSNYVITKFQETPKMQSYLLAFVVSKFKYVQSNDLNIPQKIYARNTRIENGDTDFIVLNADKILKIYEDFLGVSFPMPKMDHVIAPHYFTAIENWGVAGYSERHVFDRDHLSNVRTFLHEFAHQYFGNLVSPKWWSYVWLNEGFAKFYDTELEKLIFPDEILEIENFRQNTLFTAFMADSSINSQCLNFYVEQNDAILGKFSQISYYKGASIIQMFQEAFGLNTWRKGMKFYLEDNQYSAVEPSDLHKAIQKAVDEDYPEDSINVENVMASWEDQAGFPIISVSLENGTIKLSQERRIDDGSSQNIIYKIPMTYATSSNPKFNDLKAKFWMVEKEMEMTNFKDDWIILNNQQIGYYKVDYDENLWQAIIDQLHKNHSVIHHVNRNWLIYSLSLKIDTTENFNQTFVLKMFSYLKYEDNLNAILMSQLLLRNYFKRYTDGFDNLKSTQKDVFEVLYDKTKHLNNSKIIQDTACRLNVQNCLDDVANEMFQVLNKPKFDYDYSYCNSLKNVNETVFDIVLNKTKPLRYDGIGFQLLYGLGCVENAMLFEKLLNTFIDPEWSTNEKYPSPYAIFSNMNSDEKIEVFLDFLEKNYLKLDAESPALLKDVIAFSALSITSDQYNKRMFDIRMASNTIKDESNESNDLF